MARDTKYGRVTVELEPGTPLGEDEPVFVIRGQDVAAPDAIREYAAVARLFGAGAELVAACALRADEVERWQAENGDLVKVPD